MIHNVQLVLIKDWEGVVGLLIGLQLGGELVASTVSELFISCAPNL